MRVNCRLVWSEISNYLEDDVTPNLRTAIEMMGPDFPIMTTIWATIFWDCLGTNRF